MPPKVVNFAKRKRPSAADLDAIEQLAEAKGNAIAGRAIRPAPERPITPQTGHTGIIERPGRILADGSRRGAKTLRRMTVYLDPALAAKVKARAGELDQSMSDVIAAALDAYLG